MNPILLLHGALGSKTQLEPLRQQLEQKLHKAYSLNFSGHSGEAFSEQGFGIEVFAKDVTTYLDNKSLHKVNIFGYSMGGYVALWLAKTNPERIGKVVTLGTKFDWSPESAEKEIQKLNPEKILQKIPAFSRILEHRHAPTDWKELIHKTTMMMRSLGNEPLLTQKMLSEINHPVTILLGDQDDMTDRNFSKMVAGWLPKGTFHQLESTPHPIEKVSLPLLLKYLG